MIEQDTSDSLLLAATNHSELLDHALFRRFDDLIEYDLPEKKEIIAALKSKLAVFKTSKIFWTKAAEAANTLSYGDIIPITDRNSNNYIVIIY